MTNSNAATQKSFEDITWQKHDEYIDVIHSKFKKESKELTMAANKRINAIPNISEEERKKILLDQQTGLDKLLAKLKQDINQADRELFQFLEDHEKKQDEDELGRLLSEVEEMDDVNPK